MYSFTSLVVAVAAVGVTASPTTQPLVVPVTSVNTATSLSALVQRGLARLKGINGQVDVSPFGTPSGAITNQDVSYVAPIKIGGATWNLIVDTGSSNLWCGVNKACEKTSTGKSTGENFTVSYGSGAVAGVEYLDQVSFAGLTVKGQSLGAATSSQGFSTNTDGILGLGPVDLTTNTVTNTKVVPTFMDNLVKQKSIPAEILGVSFRPIPGSATSAANGELTLGGTDSSKYTGAIKYVHTLKQGLASKYWGVGVTGYSYGSTKLPLTKASSPSIVDTGTTLIYIDPKAYKAFATATGGELDNSSGLLSFTKAPTETFTVTIGSLTLPLTPAQYLVPKAQYKVFGLNAKKYYTWIAEGDSSGVVGILGQKLLENYYAVFDTPNARIGFAVAK